MSMSKLSKESFQNWELLDGHSVKFNYDSDGWEAIIENKKFIATGYGQTSELALIDLKESLLAILKTEPSKKASGKTNLRMPIELHEKINSISKIQGISQNDLIIKAVELATSQILS